MNTPKIIFFDYGHTLCYESCFDLKSGGDALFAHIKDKNGIDKAAFSAHTVDVYMSLSPARREKALELPCDCMTRYLRDFYSIEFDVDETALQEVYWDAISPPNPMPGADKLLRELTRRDIRTAVVSNLWYNEDVLKRRIERLLPHAAFEFYISTHAYGFRKPHKQIFELALKCAGVQPENAWYIGDEPNADIEGAYNAGIQPVWFESEIVCPYKFKAENAPTVPCIHIHNLSEITEKLL